jgi:hypothetical protein
VLYVVANALILAGRTGQNRFAAKLGSRRRRGHAREARRAAH